mmetsp:Transcript_11150/g.25322  ORF Transcript_11150/g.25322 Transcript_11150/m.25322 type:complete len:284 (-) Transcript_11150:717-1568(-)
MTVHPSSGTSLPIILASFTPVFFVRVFTSPTSLVRRHTAFPSPRSGSIPLLTTLPPSSTTAFGPNALSNQIFGPMAASAFLGACSYILLLLRRRLLLRFASGRASTAASCALPVSTCSATASATSSSSSISDSLSSSSSSPSSSIPSVSFASDGLSSTPEPSSSVSLASTALLSFSPLLATFAPSSSGTPLLWLAMEGFSGGFGASSSITSVPSASLARSRAPPHCSGRRSSSCCSASFACCTPWAVLSTSCPFACVVPSTVLCPSSLRLSRVISAPPPSCLP